MRNFGLAIIKFVASAGMFLGDDGAEQDGKVCILIAFILSVWLSRLAAPESIGRCVGLPVP